MKTREIVIYGILSAVLLAAQVSLGFLPNIEIVTLLILVYTLVFRKKVFLIFYLHHLHLYFSGRSDLWIWTLVDKLPVCLEHTGTHHSSFPEK